MAVFSYRTAGSVGGTIAADSARAARDALRSRGLDVDSLVVQESAGDSLRTRLRRPHHFASQRTAMVRELSTLLAAGIPLLDAVYSIALQQTGAFKHCLLVLRDRIAAGMSLADAMREQPAAFDDLSIHMVEVGESAGTLDAVLDQLANFSERYQQLKDKVTNALFYPIVVFLLSCGVAIFLMTVVVPMLLDNLLEADKPIPWPTRVLKTASDFARTHGFAIATVAATTFIATIAALRTERGRRFWHRTLLRLPLVGGMARKQELARMALVTATLLKSGIVLVQALEIAGRALKNVVLRDALTIAREAIQTGREIGPALESTGEFPPTVVQIFTVGQQSGKLEEMLERLADNYDRQAATLAMRLATLLEPALIISLAVLVGFILFATVLPILEAGNVL